MTISDKIRIAIIDNDAESVFNLKEHLGFFPEIEFLGSATKYNKAKNLLLHEDLNLVFMDVEMPDKSGFELLEEVRACRKQMFSIVFCSVSTKYIIQGLRYSALDYILKPVKREELRVVIDRFKSSQNSGLQRNSPPVQRGFTEIISLPTPVGLRFIDKNKIILFQYTREQENEKLGWKVLLTDLTKEKLRTGTTAKELLGLMGGRQFMQINQSVILNINYLAGIDFKTRECQLIPPYNEIKLAVSRAQLFELRNKYDLL